MKIEIEENEMIIVPKKKLLKMSESFLKDHGCPMDARNILNIITGLNLSMIRSACSGYKHFAVSKQSFDKHPEVIKLLQKAGCRVIFTDKHPMNNDIRLDPPGYIIRWGNYTKKEKELYKEKNQPY